MAFCPLDFSRFEINKAGLLKQTRGQFDKRVQLAAGSKADLYLLLDTEKICLEMPIFVYITRNIISESDAIASSITLIQLQ